MLLSGNFQSERVAAGQIFKKRYYRNINVLSICMPVLLPGNVQSEHAAAGENFTELYYRNMNNSCLCRPV